jgi:hypothetical protein
VSAIELYRFQSEGLDKGRAAYREGRRAVLFVGPTGMGKTTLASAAALGRIAKGGRVVAFAHRRELVDQMAARLTSMGLDVGARGRRPNARVQVVSVQAVLARREMPDADFAIFDEAHHYVSDEWIAAPRAYLARGALLMGLTATPERDDGRGLGGEGGIFDEIVVVAQVRELVELNAREPEKGVTPLDAIAPVDHVRRLAKAPVEAYLEHAPGRSCVVFAPNVKSAHAFAAGFVAQGVPAEVVHGELDTIDRDGAISRFARGDLRVLVNVNVLTEGWDAPICDVVMLARKIGSLALFYQCIGRARRPSLATGKTRALLLDLSGNLELHVPEGHIDDDLEYSLDGRGVARKGSATDRPRFCRVCKHLFAGDVEECAHSHRPCPVERGTTTVVAHCPECATPISKIFVPTPEDVELARVTRDAERKKAPECERTKALTCLYSTALRAGNHRNAAHHAYQRVFSAFPPTEVRVPAWRAAIARVALEKGDAWEPSS